MSLEVGDKAPDFTLPTDGGRKVSLKALKGKTLVLYFYPRDDTPGCTAEACAFRDSCEVLAVEPNKMLSYTWNFAHDVAACNLKSVVTFTLTPTSTGTHLRMEQSGFRPDQTQAYGGAQAGWQQFFAKLEQVLVQKD